MVVWLLDILAVTVKFIIALVRNFCNDTKIAFFMRKRKGGKLNLIEL